MSMPSTISTIEQFIARVGAGMSKRAEANTEPGSIGGATEHPVKDVDDSTEPAKEGARSKENTTDVKADQGAPSVDSTAEATTKAGAAFGRQFAKGGGKKAVKKADGGAVSQEGSAADDSEESPLNPQPTGQTPDIETSSAKPGKEDPGSDHPARTDNDSLDGHKYANDVDPIKVANDLTEIGNNLLGHLTMLSQGTQAAAQVQKVASARGAVPTTTKQASATVQIDPHVQMQIGYEMAGLINGTMDKKAADAMVEAAIEQVIAESLRDAEKCAHYYDNFFAAAQLAQKQAEGEDPMAAMGGGDPAAVMGGGGDPAAGGGAPPPPGGGGGGMGEDDMMAALGGGDDAGGMGGGGGEGGGGDEAAALAQLLDQLGVTEEELQQAMQEEAAGGGGGGDAGGLGGDPSGGMGGADMGGATGGMGGPEKPASDRRGSKQAAAKQGNFKNDVRDYLVEVMSRSRNRK